jgi:hypothetical protein
MSRSEGMGASRKMEESAVARNALRISRVIGE